MIKKQDSREFLKEITCKIDCIIIDPPYPLDISNGTDRFGFKKDRMAPHSGLVNKFAQSENSLFLNESDFFPMFSEIVWRLFDILKEGGDLYVFVNYKNRESISFLLDKVFCFNKEVIWDKIDIGLGADYRNSHEYILYYSKGKKQVKFSDLSVLRHRVPRTTGLYPTQKPVELLKRIIKNSTKVGDKILDCFMGSGSTLVAGKILGREVFGCDSSEDAFKITEKRLNNIKNQEVLI